LQTEKALITPSAIDALLDDLTRAIDSKQYWAGKMYHSEIA
jgi:hypothetical protein